MNFTPYVTHSMSRKDPFESFYYEPQYDGRDFEGRVVEVQKNVKNYPWESWYDDRTYINDDGEEVRWFPDGSDMTISYGSATRWCTRQRWPCPLAETSTYWREK